MSGGQDRRVSESEVAAGRRRRRTGVGGESRRPRSPSGAAARRGTVAGPAPFLLLDERPKNAFLLSPLITCDRGLLSTCLGRTGCFDLVDWAAMLGSRARHK
jgi:hypothetical protein